MRASPRRRLDPDVRRLEIIEAAERLLRKNGPAVRVEDVVREAAAAKGTFYLYFAAWDDLLETIRARIFEAFDAENPVPLDMVSASDWLSMLENLAVAFVDRVVAIGGLHSVLFHSDFARRRPIPEDVDPVGRLIRLIRAGRDAGALAEVDADLMGRLLFAVIHATADAVEAGEGRDRALDAMRWTLRRTLERKIG